MTIPFCTILTRKYILLYQRHRAIKHWHIQFSTFFHKQDKHKYLSLKVFLRAQSDVHPFSIAASYRHKRIAGDPPGNVAGVPACNIKWNVYLFNWLTPWSRILLEKLTVKKSTAFYGTWRIIIVLPGTCHHSLSQVRSIQSTHFHPGSLITIFTLSSYLHLDLLSSLYPSGLITIIKYAFLTANTHNTHPSHLIILDLVVLTILWQQ
jgi:hypothetical protein